MISYTAASNDLEFVEYSLGSQVTPSPQKESAADIAEPSPSPSMSPIITAAPSDEDPDSDETAVSPSYMPPLTFAQTTTHLSPSYYVPLTFGQPDVTSDSQTSSE